MLSQADFSAMLSTQEFPEELPMEGQGSLLETFQQAPLLLLNMSKQFLKGIYTPGTPCQKYYLSNILWCLT